jgi:2-polyprenyl-6-methoxyphenol hydroxylase-like FAD-dependent oxidoreductase
MQISWDHLYRSFRTRLPESEYRIGQAVVAVGQDADSVWLTLEDGRCVEAELVVGADGVGSTVRAAVTTTEDSPRYAGYVAWRGLLPEANLPDAAADLLLDRFTFFNLPRSHMLGYVVAGPSGEVALGRRRYNWVWYRPVTDLASVLTDRDGHVQRFSLSPGRVPEAARDALLADARVLLPMALVQAIAAEPTPFVQAIFDYEAPRMVRGRIALLGDAAFVARPHTAMGVAKAAGDALAFAAALTAEAWPAALPAYEAARAPVGREIVAYGRRLGRAFE